MHWGAARMARMDQNHVQQVRCAVAVVLVMLFTLLSGCVAQQAYLKQTERALQQKLKQQDDQLSQTRARQSQEISNLREQDLPQLIYCPCTMIYPKEADQSMWMQSCRFHNDTDILEAYFFV